MTLPAIRFTLRRPFTHPRTMTAHHYPVRLVPCCVTVVLPPEIDISNDAAVLAALTRPLAAGAGLVTADMGGTVFCGIAGVRAVMRAYRMAPEAGATLNVTGMAPQVRRVFKLIVPADDLRALTG